MLPNEPAKTFKDLVVWQKSHKFVLDVYNLTKGFPKEEIFGITSQLRRSAVSIPANIAEGFKKFTKPDKAKYINIAQASLEESRYYLILVDDLVYADASKLLDQIDEIGKILDAYYKSLQAK